MGVKQGGGTPPSPLGITLPLQYIVTAYEVTKEEKHKESMSSGQVVTCPVPHVEPQLHHHSLALYYNVEIE